MGGRHAYLVKDMSLVVGKGGFAVGTKIEVWTVDAAPPDTANGHGVAAITCYTSVNDAFVSMDFASQQKLKQRFRQTDLKW